MLAHYSSHDFRVLSDIFSRDLKRCDRYWSLKSKQGEQAREQKSKTWAC